MINTTSLKDRAGRKCSIIGDPERIQQQRGFQLQREERCRDTEKKKINFWGTDFQWHCSKCGTLSPLATDSGARGVKYPPCTGHHPMSGHHPPGTQPAPAACGFFIQTATLLPFVPSKEERVGSQGTSGILSRSQQHRECHPGTVSGIRTSLLYSRSRNGKSVF